MKKIQKVLIVFFALSLIYLFNEYDTVKAECGSEYPATCTDINYDDVCQSACAPFSGGPTGCSATGGWCMCDDGTCDSTLPPTSPGSCPIVEPDNRCFTADNNQITPYEYCGERGGASTCCSNTQECLATYPPTDLGCVPVANGSECSSLPNQRNICTRDGSTYCCSLSTTQCLGTIPEGPMPPPYISCGETNLANLNGTYTPEFHSLRPYQASPCNPRLEELDLYCGNDIITKQTFIVTPSDPDATCEEVGGQYVCTYLKESEVEVTVDLTNAELPIAGNTQLVPNQVNAGNPIPVQLSWATRMNEYVSWYLHGAPWKADEELADPQEIDVTYPKKHLITYAGPLRKLYPYNNNPYVHLVPHFPFFETQFPPDPRGDRRGVTNRGFAHNQIYLCTAGGQQNQVPCRWNFTNLQYELMDQEGTPLDPSDDTFTGIPLGVHRVAEGGSNESPWMLWASTEDRLGAISADLIMTDPILGLPVQPQLGQEGQDVTIVEAVFEPETYADLFYFPHMEENVTLSALLQRTFVPRSVSAYAPGPPDPLWSYYTYRCDLEDVRWNSGDDLFGELDGITGLTPVTDPDTGEEITGEDIKGTVKYTSEFTCIFDETPESITECLADCNITCDPTLPPVSNDPPGGWGGDCIGYCNDSCGEIEACEVDALTATSVYTRTPKAEELWIRTVAGDASAVKRMYPKIGVNGMFEELKDYPAVTTAGYLSPDAEVLAGDPSKSRPGSEAEIYIPHFGGIKVFFMDTMQDLLRPYEMNSKFQEGYTPGNEEFGQCNEFGCGLGTNNTFESSLECIVGTISGKTGLPTWYWFDSYGPACHNEAAPTKDPVAYNFFASTRIYDKYLPPGTPGGRICGDTPPSQGEFVSDPDRPLVGADGCDLQPSYKDAPITTWCPVTNNRCPGNELFDYYRGQLVDCPIPTAQQKWTNDNSFGMSPEDLATYMTDVLNVNYQGNFLANVPHAKIVEVLTAAKTSNINPWLLIGFWGTESGFGLIQSCQS